VMQALCWSDRKTGLFFSKTNKTKGGRQNWSIQRRVSGGGVGSESMLAFFFPLRESESTILCSL